jgi:TolB protein
LTPLDLPGTVGHPSWSPDGSRILYVQFGAGMRTVAADGSDLRVVSTDPFDRFPAWGPDGDIAFVNGFDLWLSDADGGNRRRLTTTPAWEFGASWSPDGTELVFTSDAR